jgi:hypothetical protein
MGFHRLLLFFFREHYRLHSTNTYSNANPGSDCNSYSHTNTEPNRYAHPDSTNWHYSSESCDLCAARKPQL